MPLHLVGVTRKILRNLLKAPSEMGTTLRKVLQTPAGDEGLVDRSSGDPYPFPLTAECREALWHFAMDKTAANTSYSSSWRFKTQG